MIPVTYIKDNHSIYRKYRHNLILQNDEKRIHELRFESVSDAEGIFFISDSGTETKVEVISVQTDGRLSFNVPANLPSGDYHIEVRRLYKINNELRKDSLGETLHIA